MNPIGPRECYDEGKRAAETLFFDYNRMHKLRIKVVRIFNTYGPRMHPFNRRVVTNFIRQALSSRGRITIFGDGSQTRSFCYCDDLVEVIIRTMNSGDDFTGPVNIGNEGEFTIKQLAEMVIELTGGKSKLVYRPLPQDNPTQRKPDIALAQDEAGLGAEGGAAGRAGEDDRVDEEAELRGLQAADAELLRTSDVPGLEARGTGMAWKAMFEHYRG